MTQKVLVTGASGFVGRELIAKLLAQGAHPVAGVRRDSDVAVEQRLLPSLGEGGTFPSLVDIDAIVHCAARVHVMEETDADPLAAFRRANVDGTLALARKAARDGVKRFVFISSIKVNGESTLSGSPFRGSDAPMPQDPYGISKWEAEQALTVLCADSGMELVVIRPVLVYGPGVKANFHSMMRWVHKGIPLPLGAINNRRSLVALDNLVDLIITCLEHPAAAGQTFLVSDGEDLSTTTLLRRMAKALNARSRLLPVPAAWLDFAAGCVRKRSISQRLLGSLQVDITHTCETLGWRPPLSVDQALKKTADSFLERN